MRLSDRRDLRAVSLAFGLSYLAACGSPSSRPNQQEERGSSEFKSRLRLGVGAARPAPLEASNSLHLTAAADGVVQLTVDPLTQNWGWVSFDTDRVPTIASLAELEPWSRAYIKAHAADLGLRSGEILSFDKTSFEPLPGTHMITFQRSFEGVTIKGAFVQFIFAVQANGSYRLREIINNGLGEIEVVGEKTPVTAQQAIAAIGISSFESLGASDVIHAAQGSQNQYVFRRATEYSFRDQSDGDEIFRVTFDNDTLDILEAYSNRLTAKQTLSLNAYTRSYVLKDEKPRPLPSFSVRVAGVATPLDADLNGSFTTDATQVTVALVGTNSVAGVVNTETAPNAFYSFPLTLPAAGGSTTLNLTQADPASLNAYLAVSEINAHAKSFFPPGSVPLFTNGIQVNVNMTDQAQQFCNAFFDGVSLNFFRAGNNCANTALVNDVVYHEWGHALDNATGIVTTPNGITDGAFSEGLGDIIAGFFINAPEIGIGFGLNDANTFIRNLKNVRRNPPANAAEAEVHSAGQIIGGAFWDLRTGLIKMMGPKLGAQKANELLFKHMTMTDRFLDSYQSLLRLDDKDQNPATRSPLYCTINKAFAAHNLSAGVTETDACIDPDQGLKVRVDVDQGNGKLQVIASSWSASAIEACSGKVTTCTSSSPGYVRFVGDGKSPKFVAPNGKLLFEGTSRIEVLNGEPVTFIGRDGTGKMVGLRTVQFKARDTSADLSQRLK